MASIVVGVDGSDDGDRVLAAGAELAVITHHSLVAVHVAYVGSFAAIGPMIGSGRLAVTAEELADHCHMYCELDLAPVSVSWTFEVRHGDPATGLLRAGGDHDAACIVVGRHGHRRFTRMVLGSVANRIVSQADRPVLVVPPEPRSPAGGRPPWRLSGRPAAGLATWTSSMITS